MDEKIKYLIIGITTMLIIIIGSLSFFSLTNNDEELDTKTTTTNPIKIKNKTTLPSTTKVTIPAYQDYILTEEECTNLISTLSINNSLYSYDQITSCGLYDAYAIYKKDNNLKIFETEQYEELSDTLPELNNNVISIVKNNNVTNINFKYEVNGEEETKTEKIAGVTNILYDYYEETNELNIFIFTNRGVYEMSIEDVFNSTTYKFDKIRDTANTSSIVVDRKIINNKYNPVYYYHTHDNKYINILTNTVQNNNDENQKVYEDNTIKIMEDRSIYVDGTLESYKVNLYILKDGVIKYIIDDSDYVYGYVNDSYQKLYSSPVTNILYRRTRDESNNSIDDYILVFENNTIEVLANYYIPELNA